MNTKPAPEHLTTRSHRLVYWIGYLMIAAVLLRRRADLGGALDETLVYALAGAFTLLYATEALVTRKMRKYPRLYFVVQILLALCLAAFQEYQDTWALLLIVLGFQVGVRCKRKEAAVWFSIFAAALLAALGLEFGLVSGLGRAAAYGVIGVLLISYDVQYARHEDTLAESQVLLAELQEAHGKLSTYADQAEELAALQERNRLMHELFDSVGQKIFAIQLAAEATRLQLEKDPLRAAGQIDALQTQTQDALGQMRQLIGAWRPDQGSAEH